MNYPLFTGAFYGLITTALCYAFYHMGYHDGTQEAILKMAFPF